LPFAQSGLYYNPPVSASHHPWLDDRCVPPFPECLHWHRDLSNIFAYSGLELWSSWSQHPTELEMTGTWNHAQLLAEIESSELFLPKPVLIFNPPSKNLGLQEWATGILPCNTCIWHLCYCVEVYGFILITIS
jgi:hypothetical protein